MAKSFFGNNAKDPKNELDNNDIEKMEKLEMLQNEIDQAREKLNESESKLTELQMYVDKYVGKERQIAEVMITAQVNAQRMEAQARANAEALLQEVDEELRRKNQELELLRMKCQYFKQDVHEHLDQYKVSLDKIGTMTEDISFTPTLVAVERVKSVG